MCKLFGLGLVITLTVTLTVPSRGDLIDNGSFETGDFTGWTRTAFTGQFLVRDDRNHDYKNYMANQTAGTPKTDTNAVVTQQTNDFNNTGPPSSLPVNPTQGNRLAFLSNQISSGDGGLTGSSISQTFVVTGGATLLSFDVQFLSNETLNSQWDFGGVALLQGSTVLAQFNLDHDPTTGTSIANAHTTANAAGGFSNSTGWLSESFSLTGLEGQSVMLIAYVTNTGDMQVESRLLFDNVRTNAVPEPSSLVLFGVGTLGLTGYTWLCRRVTG